MSWSRETDAPTGRRWPSRFLTSIRTAPSAIACASCTSSTPALRSLVATGKTGGDSPYIYPSLNGPDEDGSARPAYGAAGFRERERRSGTTAGRCLRHQGPIRIDTRLSRARLSQVTSWRSCAAPSRRYCARRLQEPWSRRGTAVNELRAGAVECLAVTRHGLACDQISCRERIILESRVLLA
jgi:hypothetical protein